MRLGESTAQVWLLLFIGVLYDKILFFWGLGVITIALSKGRVYDETTPLLKAAGIVVRDDPEQSRKLILRTSRSDVRLVIVRATDVPTYVQYGAADEKAQRPSLLFSHYRGNLPLWHSRNRNLPPKGKSPFRLRFGASSE